MAYEVARQAVNAGEQVEWLGILDAPAPSMELLREQSKLRSRLRRLRRQPARERWAKYVEVALRMLRSASLWPQNGFDYRGATEIACRYQQPGHEVPMHLFVSAGFAAYLEADLLGWNVVQKGTKRLQNLMRLPLLATGLEQRACVSGGLVDVVVSPFEHGKMCWTLDHDQVAIEASFEDEPGAGDMRTERDHDDGAPAVIRRQTVQFPRFPFGGGRVGDEAAQVEVWAWRRTNPRQPWANGYDNQRSPALFAESYSEGIPIISGPAEDEDRVSVPQSINLRSHVGRQSCHRRGDE